MDSKNEETNQKIQYEIDLSSCGISLNTLFSNKNDIPVIKSKNGLRFCLYGITYGRRS